LVAKDGSTDFWRSIYEEFAHSFCANAMVVTNKQIPDKIVLIVPGLTGMHRHGTKEVLLSDWNRGKGLNRNFQESELK